MVEVGKKGGEKKSHRLGNKRVVISLLPRKSDAPTGAKGGPRGTKSLIAQVVMHVKKDTGVIADEWTATPPAVEAAGSYMEGSVNHSKTWRNPVTGHHSNDAESEFARLKLFLCSKYGYVRASNNKDTTAKDKTLLLNIAEYMFYTNVGKEMSDVMRAFRHAGGVTGTVVGMWTCGLHASTCCD